MTHERRNGPRRLGTTAFVGRERPLTQLVDALRRPRSVVVVEGEAGIGKTRLVREALLHSATAFLRTLTVACPPLDHPFPLGPVVDALRHRSLAGVALTPLAGALRPLFPEWTDRLPPSPEPLEDPEATRHRSYRALHELIERLAIDVVVVDDAHWADAATVELLLLLAAAPWSDLRLVLTYRPTDVPTNSLLRRLTSRAAATGAPIRITLDPLTVEESGRLASSMFDTDDVSPSFAAFLHDRTDGIPFALEESLSVLHERGDIVWSGRGWTRRIVAELSVPPTIRDSVLERVARLDDETRSLLAAAAVLAEPADDSVLGAVAGLDAERTAHGIVRGLDSGLLHETERGSYGFRHVLASQAVEEAIPVSVRRRLHGRAARTLQARSLAPVARLSRHFREANDVAAWSRYTEAAADTAMEAGNDQTAVALLLELLSVDHPPDHRSRLAYKLAEASAWGAAALGDLAPRVTGTLRAALDALDALGSVGEQSGETRLLLGRLLLQLGEFDAAAEQIAAAAGALDDKPQLAARAMISLGWPRGNVWSADRHRDWLNRASTLIPQVPAGPDRTWLEVDRASVLLMLGDELGWEAAAAIAPPDPTLFDQRQLARLAMNQGHVGIAWGHDDDARRRLEDAITLMEQTGYRRLLNSARLTLALLDWNSGRWTGLAERVRILADADDTLPEARLDGRHTLAMLDLVRGDRAAAQFELRAVRDEAADRGVADGLLAPAAALGRLLLADGKARHALAVTGPALETVVLKDMWQWAGGIVSAHLDALVAEGDVAAAGTLLDRFAAALDGSAAPAPLAALLVGRGIVDAAHDDQASAVDRFGEAAATWAAIPRPYDALLARERQARSELAAADTDRALRRLTDTQSALRELGAVWDADRVARLLRQHGVEVARIWRGGRRGYGDALSPREREVAGLVTHGMTNREIAEKLFLSPRTVDRHLSAAMRKLGVRSRTALAVAMAEPQPDTNIG